jgi:hypothetical protein
MQRLSAEQQSEWLEEWAAWKASPMTRAFYQCLSQMAQAQRDKWAASFDHPEPPGPQYWSQLKFQALAIEDITNLTGEDILDQLQAPAEAD